MGGCVRVNQSKRIASKLFILDNPGEDLGLDRRPLIHIIKTIKTRLLIRHGGAHPRLHVGDLEPPRLVPVPRPRPRPRPITAPELPHLREGATYLVDGVAEGGAAVTEGGGGGGVDGGEEFLRLEM
ncbi:hypothetical protein Dimus_014604 [Dionaea muscipula]